MAMTLTTNPAAPHARASALGATLAAAWGSWGPTMTPDARRGGLHQRPHGDSAAVGAGAASHPDATIG